MAKSKRFLWEVYASAFAILSLASEVPGFVPIGSLLSRLSSLPRARHASIIQGLSGTVPARCSPPISIRHTVFTTTSGLKRQLSSTAFTMVGDGGEGKFVKMGGAEDTQSFGPRCIVAGGLSPPEFVNLRLILQEEDGGPTEGDADPFTPLILLTPDLARSTLGEVLGDAPGVSAGQGSRVEEGKAGTNAVSFMSPVILVSGFTNPQLRGMASRFRQMTGVRAAFAKAVPNAMRKTMCQLCEEIAQDHADALAGRLDRPQGS